MELASKIIMWYLILGFTFTLFVARNLDFIVDALMDKYRNDEKRKNISRKAMRNLVLAIIVLLWPIFVISLIRNFL